MRRTVVGRATHKNETTVAIAAFDHTALVDFEPYARMPQRCRHAFAAAIACDTVGADKDGFGRVDHAPPLAKPGRPSNGAFH